MTYTQAGQELVRALDFEYLKKNFLSHPEMLSIVIQAGKGQHIRLFRKFCQKSPPPLGGG